MKGIIRSMVHTYLSKVMLVLTLLIVGMGNAWADEVCLTENFSSSAASTNTYDCSSGITTAANQTDWNYKWTPSGSGTVFQNGIKLGKSKGNGGVANSSMLDGIDSGTTVTIKVYAAVWNEDGGQIKFAYNGSSETKDAANDPITSTSSSYDAADFENSTDFEITIAEGVTKFQVESSVKRILIDKIEVVYSASNKTATTTSFGAGAQASYTVELGQTFSAPTATVTGGEGLVPTYSSSNDTVATVDASTGAVSILAVGQTTITAKYAGNDTYAASSASYSLTVTAPMPVFDSLEALTAADITSGTTVKVSFANVPIKSIYTTSQGYRNGVYFDIQKEGNDIEIYFKNVPETWVVEGKLSGTMTCPWKKYNNTWELAPDSDWSWDQLTYEAPAITTKQEATITAEYKKTLLTTDAPDVYAIIYDGDGTLSVSSSDTAVATVSISDTTVTVTPVAKGSTTIKIAASATDNYYAAEKSYTLTVEKPALPASLPFEFDGGREDIEDKDGISQSGLGSDYSASPKLKFDDSGDYLIIQYNEAAKKISYKLKGNGTTGANQYDILESVDGSTYTSVHSHDSIADGKTETFTDTLKAASRYVKFIYTTKKKGNVALGAIKIIEASAVEDPELAFEKVSYVFFSNTSNKQVKAVSGKGSTGNVTYALASGDANAFSINDTTGVITCTTNGEYTVKATIAAATGYTAAETTCTVKIKDPVAANSIIVAEVGDKCYAMTTENNDTYFGYKEIVKAGDKYAVDGDMDAILFYTSTSEGKTVIVSPINGLYVQSTGAKHVSYTENAYEWSNDSIKLTAATSSHGTLQFNTSSPRFTTYASKVGQYAMIVSLDDVVATSTLPTPSGLASKDVTATTATLKWNAVDHAAGYNLLVGQQVYETTADSIALTELTPETEYTWKVQAVGDGGIYQTSEFSAEAVFTTLVAPAAEDTTEIPPVEPIELAAPTNLLAEDITMNSAVLKWDSVEHASGYMLLVDSLVYENAVSPFNLSALLPESQHTWTVQALGDGVNYKSSPLAEMVTFTTLADTIPADTTIVEPIVLAAPTNLAAVDVLTTSVTLKWDTVANAVSYDLMIDSVVYEGVSSPFELTGLQPETQYTWTVRAVGDGETYLNSAFAEPVSFTTLPEQPADPVVLAAPTHLTVDELTSTSAVLKWDSVEQALAYVVMLDSVAFDEVSDTLFSLDTLTPDTQYTWTVKAIGDGKFTLDSEYAASVTFTTPKEEVAIQLLRASDSAATSTLYDLNGRPIQQIRSGLNLSSGKLIFVK